MTTIEQVEKLREKIDVSYEEAKAALDITDGDLLEAVIYLEKSGKIDSPHMSTYNTHTGGIYGERGDGGHDPRQGAYRNRQHGHGRRDGEYDYKEYEGPRFRDHMRNLWKGFCALVRKGNTNYFVVISEGNDFLRMPVTLFVLAILCFPWVMLPLIVIGLFCSCRYEFRGPNIRKADINNMMDKAADKAESIKRSVAAEAAAEGYDHNNRDWERDDDD